jgi:hypothetical protein
MCPRSIHRVTSVRMMGTGTVVGLVIVFPPREL